MPVDQAQIEFKKDETTAVWQLPGRPTDKAIVIQNCGYGECFPVVTIYLSGRVEFGKGFTGSDADKAFWDQLGASLPLKCE